MAIYRQDLPQMNDAVFLAYIGMETDLKFNQRGDLPGLASYPLFESKADSAMPTCYRSKKALEELFKFTTPLLIWPAGLPI